MATIEHSAILAAAPERVFALLERVEDFADYSDLIHSIEPLGDDRFRWHVHAVGRDWHFDVAITERRAPEALAWESLDGVENRGRYRLRPVEGGTEVSLTLTYTLRSKLLERAVNKAATPLVNRVSRQILERVEQRL
ncbi:SRPBCC family protein [Halomonas sp. KAO]|uniref:SRPBCC family protein n=1 Tax=unclassified Halomonas TaxID=2609666 RepID=UPI00189DDA1C|nr:MULTISPECIES: SRPBCC family protein [unclassified Halomonas]MBF7052510.1 SRPBCC family protein [Halomonas sp. KAO]MDT0500553.1 SRPBCC family protein [Halomonas sp. PAR7]MDT0511551.1 SRPBCC family protein [Halomonas sp. LES1]MDT0590161.1 SRPBCC family protein [Halomonas sp. PAR8]